MTTYQHPETTRDADGVYRCKRCGAAAARESALALLPCKGVVADVAEAPKPVGRIIESPLSEPPLPKLGTLWANETGLWVFCRFPDEHYNWRGLRTGLERMGQMALPGDGTAVGTLEFGTSLMVDRNMVQAWNEGVQEHVEDRLRAELTRGLAAEHAFPVDAMTLTSTDTAIDVRFDARVFGVRLPKKVEMDQISRPRLEVLQSRLSPR